MKKMFVSFCLAAAFLLAGKMEVQAQQCFNSDYWHKCFTQNERNARLVLAAQSQIGAYGGECKDWVKNIVRLICGVQVPSSATSVTVPNPWYWQMPAKYIGTGSSIVPGCIIQMKWTNRNGTVYPHTAIVAAVTSTGFDFIDCNWQFDGRVLRHSVTYSVFYQDVGPYYSVYVIQ